MEDSQNREERILRSWHANAGPWTSAVREGQIESRRLVTDLAVIDAVRELQPARVLDLGCGEGWLTRTLSRLHMQVIGVDAVPELVESARSLGGEYRLCTYGEIAAGESGLEADLVVCNFSLIGKDSAEAAFRAAHRILPAGGHFVVQTLHPVAACGDEPYEDGWREGSWTGFGDEFTDPAPWYFRTMDSWVHLFEEHGFRLTETKEPMHPRTENPTSVIFVAMAILEARSSSSTTGA
jgi:2-polyprenyl-3-methyl-5-hydroxy-6-metoxy-1,4-benzoquinol methylase